MRNLFLKLTGIPLVMICLCIFSCSKDDDNLREEIDNLEARVSDIENQLTEIDNTLIELKEQGKLNQNEIMALKELSTQLSEITTTIKNQTNLQADNILSLKKALENSQSTVQYEELKSSIKSIQNVINDNYAEQKLTAEGTLHLQESVERLSDELNKLKAIESTQEIVGKIEKGAFTKGSLITLFEMDTTLSQTGRSFNGTINDNLGSFYIKVKNLKGKLARVVADGFFYNEVSNKNSISKISLTGLIKIDSSEIINVNVLTHLEEPRVKYLMTIEGKSFDEAKKQAVTEVLASFGISNPGITRAEKVSLFGTSTSNNIALALSTMLVGFRSESQLVEILNDIAQDLQDDGTLSNVDLGNEIFSHLYYLNKSSVVNQVKHKYTGIYPDSILNNISLDYISAFTNLNLYTKTRDLIQYPAASKTTYLGLNSLNTNVNNISSSVFEASSIVSTEALKLKVEISADFSSTGESYLSSLLGTLQGWTIIPVGNNRIILESTGAGLNTVALTIQTPASNAVLNIKYYENGGETPTRTKTLTLSY
ncbi:MULTISPECIES: hypothetical protein [Olivibacter]|uniref:DUF4988 domain-containing protein n=1 Tax=Olivibacter jilunii TaxID=985016 RepID=A0ABW6BB75_9SPHI|nr:hypothetical protein [Olivibacter sp. UJ_SKK_5.1]MDX3912811.1 hypothetical protein [Pseudosphingobacterium sp.]